MEDKKYIEDAKEKVDYERDVINHHKQHEKFHKRIFRIGLLGGVVYFGLRELIGPEIYSQIENVPDVWQIMDGIAGASAFLLGGTGGIGYGFAYISRKTSERRLRKAASELEILSSNYKARGKR